MTVDEFLEKDNADETWHNADDGSTTSGDDTIDKIKNDWADFWDNITNSFGDFTKVLMIALGVVGGLFVTVLLIKFISVLFSGKRGRRK